MRSGLNENMPYSLSRWTDLSAKWAWFESCLAAGKMIAMDPVTTAPSVWSLRPEETLGLVVWTKDPSILVARQLRLEAYRLIVNLTATGWSEVERGAPRLEEAGRLLVETAKAFPSVRWRFSPIPCLRPDVLVERFSRLLEYACRAGLREVFVSYLQPNGRLPETRSAVERFDQLNALARLAASYGIRVVLCKDDRSFDDWSGALFTMGACVGPDDFPEAKVTLDSCGCVRMVDPFTVNEACTFGCTYCYAADRSLAPRKRNTVGLTVLSAQRVLQ